ncbi:MAG: hypothetical protein GEV12_01665 [Micromonosporaceae bacterium]|nr:hypothetical protein [Micromonosporaceae bacterium]
MSSNRVIIYEKPGADPATSSIVTEHAGSRTTLLARDPSAIVATAIAAVDGGADQVELCGVLGPTWHAKVLEAVGDRVPVGAVMFGFESLTGVADFKARYGKEFLREAFIYLQPGSDPAVDRTVTENEHAQSWFVAVPDVSTAAEVAAQLVDGEGVRLLELYGGFGPAEAARVIEAVGGRAPVGIPSYGYAGAEGR